MYLCNDDFASDAADVVLVDVDDDDVEDDSDDDSCIFTCFKDCSRFH